ncbi:MAG: sulfur carrier protein ThiS [Succinatimonas sp.]|nr:sulfur carrier protein ThiS [Succinatimonas sp.]
MQIIYNHEPIEVPEGQTLKLFLEARGVATYGCAAACDEEIIPKTMWESFTLKEGMKLDVFSLVAGG